MYYYYYCYILWYDFLTTLKKPSSFDRIELLDFSIQISV